MLEYQNSSGNTVNFGEELLRDYGYDLVILDLPKGGDYIERNAMVCIEVINFINRKLQEGVEKDTCKRSVSGVSKG